MIKTPACMFKFVLCLAAIAALASVTSAAENTAAVKTDRVLAIDVLLLPDAKMNDKATAVNARLRANYPQGYTLGADQVPHITLVHRFVRENDLPAIEKALEKVLAQHNPLREELTANGYTSAVWGDITITTIGIERTIKLGRLQEEVVKAVQPFAVDDGTTAAFSTTKELPKVEEQIVDYVKTFVPKASGQNYRPHVTVGVANADFVKDLKAAPFENFTFKPAAAAIYQLGSFGTAQKELWRWKKR
jgi:2'-5' RNA ligase